MTWILEHPWHVGIAGGLLAVMIGGGWVQTGRRALLLAAIAVAVVAAILVLIALSVVTDRQRVERTLRVIAEDVESNDATRLLRHISVERPDVRAAAAAEMPRYHFDQVKITNIHEITVNMDNLPPRADVKFNVVVTGGTSSGMISGQRYPRYVELVMYLEDGEWRVAEYRHEDPTFSMRRLAN